jgi:hypothetical protein
MTESITNTADAVAELGALPMSVGPEPLTARQKVDEAFGIEARLFQHALDRVFSVLAEGGFLAAPSEVATLRSRIAVLEAERRTTNEALDDAVGELRTSYAERARRESHPGRRQAWRMLAQAEESERVAEALVSPKASRSADRLRALLAGQREAAAVESGPKCRCGEPGTDPYACEADDCTASFSELNPFAGGPVEGHDAKVSRKCGCGWSTSVWHVDDGSAEEELHGHVTREHDGVYPAKSGGA